MRPCTEKPSRLADEDEVHAAAMWRLADWSIEAVEAGTAMLVRLLEVGAQLDAAQPAVAEVLARLQRLQPTGDRRDSWSAACALLALAAENRGDMALYWRAGFEVLQAHRQAARGSRPRAGDALDEILRANLKRRPEITARELFRHCAGLAGLRHVVEDFDIEADALEYRPRPDDERLKALGFHAFEGRVSRLRKRLAMEGKAQPFQATLKGSTVAPARSWSR